MAFPSLVPTSRAFDPGDYPVRTFKSQNGAETRILYGSERTNVKLQLSYANIGDASAELFLDHFDETKGTFSTFDLPDGSLGGWSGNTDALRLGTSAKYRYESAPQITQVAKGISTVTVNLIGVV